MKFGGPWNLRGLRPETLAAARDAARRSGVSVGEWLNELIEQSDDFSPASLRSDDDYDTEDYVWPEVSRDDDRRRGRSRPPLREYDDRPAGRESVLAREQLGEVHARLDRLTGQLEKLVHDKAPLRGAPVQPPHRSLQHRNWLPGGGLAADRHFADVAETAPALVADAGDGDQTPQFPELEEQLRHITAQLESLRSTGLDKVITALRGDLGEIRRQFTKALPRKAVESLCVEVEALARRIAHSRERTGDSDAIAAIERGLAEVRDALRIMTPAENLIGFDEALKTLAQKLDLIIAREDPAALRQLETALGALRGIVSHVASNDALNNVAEDVRSLAAKVDGLAKGAASGQAVSALGNRIDTLTDTINASAEVAAPRGLEKLLSDTMERLESVRLTTDPAAFKRLEERIAQLIGRLEASDARLGNMAAVERGVTDLLAQMEQLRGADAAPAEGTSSRPAVAAIARDVAEIRRSEQRTQESLEAVHGTVEQVVGRLAMIESDIHDVALRAPRSQMPAQPAAEKAELVAATPSQVDGSPAELIAAADRQDFIAAARRATQATQATEAAAAPDDQIGFRSRRRRRSRSSTSGEMQASKASRLRKLLLAAGIVVVTVGCLQIALHIFQDSRPGGGAVAPWQRPAEPNTQPEENTAPPRSGSLQPPGKPNPGKPIPSLAATTEPMPLAAPSPAPAPDAEAVGKPSAAQNPEPAAAAEPAPPPVVVTGPPPSAAAEVPAPPQSGLPTAADSTGSLAPRAMPSAAAASPPPSSTGTAMNAPELSIDALPAAIGGPTLRAAAMAGDRSAQYEIALRFGEGRGVPRSERQAAYWLELAAKQGLAPAQFRLGGYYEKGIGVKKDLAAARDLYLAAATKGNGKAMHNLAVLYADGVTGRVDYHAAAIWFRKAADRGITDSQYNLAMLYARGSGEPQNYAEAYKWFALAAKQGDIEAANKRDEIAAQLDEATLAAADLVVKNWRPEPQPDEAVRVKIPPGGWDAAAPTPKAKPRTQSANLAAPDSRAD